MEASLHGDAIVLGPRAVVDRHEAAVPSEEQIVKKAIAEIDRSRRERARPQGLSAVPDRPAVAADAGNRGPRPL